jgi:hypothetical protein
MQGLQVFDAGGTVVLDVTDRLTRVLGSFSTGTTSGSITDNNLASGTPWFVAAMSPSQFDNGYAAPTVGAPYAISFTSNSISWTFGTGTATSIQITYGVF